MDKENDHYTVLKVGTEFLYFALPFHYPVLRTRSNSNETYIKRSPLKKQFQKRCFRAEKLGESMPILANVNMYVFKSFAAISGELQKSSEMAAHNLNAYILIFFPCFCKRKYQKC